MVNGIPMMITGVIVTGLTVGHRIVVIPTESTSIMTASKRLKLLVMNFVECLI